MNRRLFGVMPFAVLGLALLSSRLVDGVVSVLLPITIVVLVPLIVITVPLGRPFKRPAADLPWWRESAPSTTTATAPVAARKDAA
jgi:hypothetical protein